MKDDYDDTYRLHEAGHTSFANYFGFALGHFRWIRFQVAFDIGVWLLAALQHGQSFGVVYLQQDSNIYYIKVFNYT